jgi:hypothetical protein
VPYLGQAEMNLPYACSLDGKNYLASHTFLEVLLEMEATIVFIFHLTFTCIWAWIQKSVGFHKNQKNQFGPVSSVFNKLASESDFF